MHILAFFIRLTILLPVLILIRKLQILLEQFVPTSIIIHQIMKGFYSQCFT